MKDKEKQIEEMANDIPYLTLSRQVFVSMTEMKNVGWTLSEEDNKIIAEVLIKNGWIKPDKDSVVLSRDNYNRLKRDSDLFEELLKKKVHLETVIELSNAQHEKVVEENKSLLRLISLIDDLPEESLLDLDKWIETIKAKASKETVEKILNEIYKVLWDEKTPIANSFVNLDVKIREIATREGVEIKE